MPRPLFALTLTALLLSGCQMLDEGYGMDDGYGPPPPEWDGGAPAQPYRAVGTEPFWSVTIDDREMRYESAVGTAVAVPVPPPVPIANGERYSDRRMEVTIVERQCSDGMSDNAYPDTVTVRLDGRTFYGCGGLARAMGEDYAPPPPGRDTYETPPRFGTAAAADRLNGEWRVVSIDGRPARDSVLGFADGRITGRSCNRLFGDYRLDGRDRIALDGLAATRMACPGDRMAEENALLDAMQGTLTVRDARGGELELTGAGGRRVILAPQ